MTKLHKKIKGAQPAELTKLQQMILDEFGVKINEEFYVLTRNGDNDKWEYLNKQKYRINRFFRLEALFDENYWDYGGMNITFLLSLNELKLTKIPYKQLLTDEEKEFLRYFKFDTLIKYDNLLELEWGRMYTNIGIDLLDLKFDSLEKRKVYIREELRL